MNDDEVDLDMDVSRGGQPSLAEPCRAFFESSALSILPYTAAETIHLGSICPLDSHYFT